MVRALGMIEIMGLSSAIEVADIMVKTADVSIANIERAKGMGWITVKVRGDVAAVNAAISAGRQVGESFGHYVTHQVIARPHESVAEIFCDNPDPDKRKNELHYPKDSEPTPPADPKPAAKPKAKAPKAKVEVKEEEPQKEILTDTTMSILTRVLKFIIDFIVSLFKKK